MVMELVEQPSKRNRLFKSQRVSTKRTRRIRSRRNRPTKTRSEERKTTYGFLEYGTRSGNRSRLKEHVSKERKTYVQVLKQ
jgi:hypothetical protein